MITSRRLILLSLVSLLGYASFFTLFPRYNVSTGWRQELDRAAAIGKAREAAARFDFDANNSKPAVESDLNRDVEYYLRTYPQGKFASLLSPLTTSVRFNDFRARRNFKATFNSRGQLLGVERHRRPPGSPPRPDNPNSSPPPQISEEERNQAVGVAEKALGETLGNNRSLFVGPPTISDERNGLRLSWLASDEQLRVIAEVSVHEGKATVVRISPSPTSRFRNMMEARQSGAVKSLLIADGLVLWPAVIAVIIAYFIGLARHQINHRRTLLFLLICVCFFLFVNIFGEFLDSIQSGNIQINGAQPPPVIDASLPLILFAILNLAFAGGMYFLYASGSSLYTESSSLRALDLALAIKGKIWTAPVVRSLVAGLLAGGIECAIPYVTAASRLFPQMMIGGDDLEKSFTSRAPALVSFATPELYKIFTVFAFIAPLIAYYVHKLPYEKLILFLCVSLVIIGAASASFSLSAVLIISILSAYLLTWTYYRFGVLAVLITVMASHSAATAASLLQQPNASLHGSGWKIIAGITVFLLIGLVGLWKARPLQAVELAKDMAGMETRAERERLKAEFEVAARAQQHMLPDAPPALPGIRFAAVCIPSKEVGGDLYDFLDLPNGKVGVVVADVSGKGVPASLYMTLTKGLLDSISEEKTDPGEILREANRHLYDTCKRKMFVTLFLGVIDPAARTMTYARAGHNPTIFRRASEQSTDMLKSRGMGLGLNNGKLFDQSLKVESLNLIPGDKLFFYSDGITEAMNRKNEEYGEERLMAVAAATDQMTAVEARDAVLTNVTAFLGGNPPQDDQTLVVVEITG